MLEGGNAEIEGHSSDSINLITHNRDHITKDIFASLKDISSEFKNFFGVPLWSKDLLDSRKFMSGSTIHFFNKDIPSKEFVGKKNRVGDIDVMVDENFKAHLIDFLNKSKNKTMGEMTLLAHKASAGTQISIWHLPKYNINVQVDFELVDYDNSEPTEWSKFSRSSDWGDMSSGIKGAMHKLLMRALMSKDRVDMVIRMKTKDKEETSTEYALSPSGLRQRYLHTGETKNGKGVYTETKGEFNKNLSEIIKHVFGVEPKEEDIRKFWNFGGMIELIKKHFNPEDQNKTVNGFLRLLFGSDAQGLYRGDPHRDMEEKMTAVDYMDSKGLKIDRELLSSLQKEFYSKYK